ncbi:hypothetical protein [uncultured Helicobacter sp.]|uniref:hypothetical protein n=1 Tax=uncultured Helicobacter sp. TaxID=175537 RepID=UPI0025E54EEA|nr:hypothetical protein [uncultured Helicobacter sp.]
MTRHFETHSPSLRGSGEATMKQSIYMQSNNEPNLSPASFYILQVWISTSCKCGAYIATAKA